MSSTMPVHMQGPVMEDSMAAALPADLSVEPTSMSLRGPSGQGSSSLLSASGQSPFSGLEMSQMLGGQIFPFGPSKEVTGPQGSNEQGIQNVGPGGGGWQPQHSGVDSYYGGPPPSGYTGQFINPGAGIPPPHMLVYTNPFAPVGQFGQLGFMGPTYLPSGKISTYFLIFCFTSILCVKVSHPSIYCFRICLLQASLFTFTISCSSRS